MTYPTNTPDWRALLLAYNPQEDQAEAIHEAQAAASPVVGCVTVFNALKSVPDLDQNGVKLLLGAAHLIAAGGWHGLSGEAAMLIGQRARDVMPDPSPGEPEPA